jgi:hypothetical protein
MRDLGKLGEILRMMSGSNESFSLDYIKIEGKFTDDPSSIHKATTDFFHKWFSGKKELQFGFHKDKANIFNLMNNKEHFLAEHCSTGIPPHLLETIWKAISSPTSTLDAPRNNKPTLREEMGTDFSRCPTRTEFDTALHSMSDKSVGGMTGCTYTMMKCWPPEILNHLFECLSNMWSSNEIPEFWQWRWLCPIVKASGSHELEELRPLMLVETSRKLWTGIIINRIKRKWDSENMLNHMQHGFRARHGTCTATIQLINALEANRAANADLLVSSWDMKRAFDSVGKNIQVASWIRLGVPPKLAHYLSHLDTNGKTVIRSPLARKAWEDHKYNGFSNVMDSLPNHFDCERGTGQGDVGSPTNWAAFMDILLAALSSIDAGLFITNGIQSSLPCKENAFADDLISIAATHRTLQLKADVVSAFAAIFGMEIRADKLRLFRCTWSDDINTDNDPPSISLHHISNGTWTAEKPVIIKTGSDPTDGINSQLKHLGVLHDPAGFYNLQLEESLLKVKLECNLILHSRADPVDKFMALRVRAWRKAAYAAKFTAWPLEHYERINVAFRNAFKSALQLMQSHPNALLSLPPSLGGLGIPDFSVLVQKEKIGILHRAKHADPGTRHAAEAIIMRAAEQCNRYPSPHQKTTLRSSAHSKINAPYWIDSLLQYYGNNGLSITLGGTSNNLQDKTIEEVYRAHNILLSDSSIRRLQCHGISNLGDLLTVHPNYENQDDPYDINLCSAIKPLLPNHGSPITDYIADKHISEQFLRVGTCWEFRRSLIAEILGIASPGKYSVRLWEGTKKLLQIHPNSMIRGNGSTCFIEHSDLFQAEFANKYILSPDMKSTNNTTFREVLACLQVNSPKVPHIPPLVTRQTRWDKIIQDLPICLKDYDIYTDGSWKRETTLGDYLLGNTNPMQVAASAAIVLLPKDLNWKALPTYCIRITEGELLEPSSVYPLELLAIAAAHDLALTKNASSTIHSDSKGAVKKVNNLHYKIRTMGHNHEIGIYEAINNIRRKAPWPIEVQWIAAHTGKSSDSHLWKRNVWGNHVADRIAQGDLLSLPSNIICLPCPSIDVTASLEKHIDWYVTDNVTNTIVTSHLDDRRHRSLFNSYMVCRDSSRTERGLEAKWFDCSATFAIKHNYKVKGIINQVVAQKTIFDKYWHGGNQAKSIPLDTPDEIRHDTIKCPLCDDEDSQAHHFMHCGGIHNNLAEVRKECMIKINQVISKMREKHDPLTMNLIESIRDMLHTEFNGHDILLGRWSEKLLSRLQSRLGVQTNLDKYTCSTSMRSALGELMVIFNSTWRTLWSERNFQIHCSKAKYDTLQYTLACERKLARETEKLESVTRKAKEKERAKLEVLAAKKRAELGLQDISCYLRRTNAPYRMSTITKRTNIIIEDDKIISPYPSRHIKPSFNATKRKDTKCPSNLPTMHNHTICIKDTNSLVRGTIS